MRRGIFTLLSIIASGSLFPAEIPPWLHTSSAWHRSSPWKPRYPSERKPSYIYEQQWAEERQSHARFIEAAREFGGLRNWLDGMKEGQVLLLNIAPTGVDNNVMQELAQKKNNGLQTMHTIDSWRFLDPKTGKQLWRTREYRDALQKFINHLVKPPFNKDEFGFAKPIYRDNVLYLPPIHFLIGKNGKVLDRWSSRKDKLTVEDIMKRVNKVAPKLKGE
jgi:hypothetical protein